MRRLTLLIVCCMMPISGLAQSKPDAKTIEYLQRIASIYDGKLPMTRGKVVLIAKKFVEPNAVETTYRFVNDDPKANIRTNGLLDRLIAREVQAICSPPLPWAAIRDGAEFRTRYEVDDHVETRVLNRETCHAEVRKAQVVLKSCGDDAQCKADRERTDAKDRQDQKTIQNFEPLKPRYPPKEFIEGITGDCQYLASVNARGVAQDVKILKSTGNRNLDRSCMFAGLYSEYPPAKDMNDSRLRQMSVNYSFVIDEESRARALKEKAEQDAAKAKP